MKKIYLDNINRIEEPCAVAIGKFDGIHRGHIKLLNRLLEESENGLKTVVFTFEKSIASFFAGKDLPSLMVDEEKEEYLSMLGIDILAVYPVNEKSVNISPRDFVTEVLCCQLNAKVIVAGPDLSYAKSGAGNFSYLEEMSEKCGFKPVKIEKEIYLPQNCEISSTLVREKVIKGDMMTVTKLLGRPYSISGVVSHGRKLGRTMSFPTVNIIADGNKILPPFGVYLSRVIIGSTRLNGVANVGIKPTISDHEKPCVEMHIFNFDEEMYGERITIELLDFLRREQKFSSVDELKAQLAKDVKCSRMMFETKDFA